MTVQKVKTLTFDGAHSSNDVSLAWWYPWDVQDADREEDLTPALAFPGSFTTGHGNIPQVVEVLANA